MPLVRRRPVLRAAAIGGGAYYAGKRRQEAKEREGAERMQIAERETHTTEPGSRAALSSRAPGPSQEAIEKLERLGKLHEQGVLTDEEFAGQKATLLDA